jgi:hypothetical protein
MGVGPHLAVHLVEESSMSEMLRPSAPVEAVSGATDQDFGTGTARQGDSQPEPRRRRLPGRRGFTRVAVTAAIAAGVLGLASPAQASSYDVSGYYDLDGNGTWDYVWDWDADGDVDALYFDWEGDGWWNIGIGDVVEDGIPDLFDGMFGGYADFVWDYSDYDQNGWFDQPASSGTSLVIDMGCGDGHCVSPDMGMVGDALPMTWQTFGTGGFAPYPY